MSAVLLAVLNDYESASRLRVALFKDGFPNDRVELTASSEPGRAGLEPAGSDLDKFAQYFQTVLGTLKRSDADALARQIEGGGATITLHPRGAVEMERATEIFECAGASEIFRHDLENQTLEYAAARRSRPWISHLWLESSGEYHCIYCRMYGRREPSLTNG